MLNMDRLEAANAAMKEICVWKLDTVYSTVARVSFDLWDYRFARNFDIVMIGLMCRFKERYNKEDPAYTKFISTHLITMSGKDLAKTISDTLRDTLEYLEWNAARGNDDFFIDLDAFDQNIYCELRSELIMSTYFEKEIENDD